MAYVGKVTAGGNTGMLIGSTLFGVCQSAIGESTKAVTIPGFDTLIEGVTIHVLFQNGNNASSFTLNVSSTGSKNVSVRGRIINIDALPAGTVVSFTYRENAWYANDWSYDYATTLKDGLMAREDVGKLAGIESGAEVNQNAYSSVTAVNSSWGVISGASVDAYSKTSELLLMQGANITLQRQYNQTAGIEAIKISATNTTYTNMTQSEATTGTETIARSISAKVLNDTIDAKISSAQVGAATFKGTVNAPADISGLTSYKRGWYWVVATAGTYVGQSCEAGDMIFCISDYNSSYKASDFSVVQNNLDLVAITTAEIDAIVAA